MDGPGSPPHIIDAAIVALIAAAGLIGLARGAGRELRALARLVLAAAVAIVASPYAEPFLADLIAPSGDETAGAPAGWATRLVEAGSALLPFVAVWVVLGWLPASPRRQRGRSRPDLLSRSLGLVLGLIRGGAIVILLFLALSWATAPAGLTTWTTQARLPPLLERVADLIRPDGDSLGEPVAEPGHRLRDLSVPVPNSGAPSDEPSYNRRSRDQLDRLIEGTR